MNTAQHWISEHARPLDRIEPLVAAAATAAVVGLGETTRESDEIERHRVAVTKALVADAGYRIIVIPDSGDIAEDMEDYVLGRRSDVEAVVLSGWPPNRTEAMADLLRWLRAFNERHDETPVRILGNGPGQARIRDYGPVIEYAEQADPVAADRIRELYDVIRTAHEVGEHIQIHNGTHPGRSFADSADEALELVRTLSEAPSKADAVARAELIADFHRNAVAAQPDFAVMFRDIADRIIDAHESTGAKVVYLDGFGLTGALSAAEFAVGPGAAVANPGQLLREHFGAAYVSVLWAFGHGTIRGGMAIPRPSEGYVERELADSGVGDALLALGDSHEDAWPGGAFRLRIIAGIYDPEEDDRHGIDIPSLRTSADFLGFVETITEARAVAA